MITPVDNYNETFRRVLLWLRVHAEDLEPSSRDEITAYLESGAGRPEFLTGILHSYDPEANRTIQHPVCAHFPFARKGSHLGNSYEFKALLYVGFKLCKSFSGFEVFELETGISWPEVSRAQSVKVVDAYVGFMQTMCRITELAIPDVRPIWRAIGQ